MKTLLNVTWTLFALDALLAIVIIIGGLTDKGDAAGRGLGLVYAVFCGIALLVLAIIVGVSVYFKTRIGLGISILLEASPWAVLLYEAARRIIVRM